MHEQAPDITFLMHQQLNAETRAQFHALRDEKFATNTTLARLDRQFPEQHLPATAKLIYDALIANYCAAYGAYLAQAAVSEYNGTHEEELPEAFSEAINARLIESMNARVSMLADHTRCLATGNMGRKDAEDFMGSVIGAATKDFNQVTDLSLRVPPYALGEIHAGRG